MVNTPNMSSGKTSPERSAATKARTSVASSKNSPKSKTIAPLFLVLQRENGKNAGYIMGDDWSLAWRVMDAQFWGVPQRRRRIALVVDFRGQSAPEILFK